MTGDRVFLLSPANTGGPRGRMLLNPAAGFELARRLQRSSAPVGELFAFVSGLYFRGKLSYAERFGRPPSAVPPALVITAGRGLVTPETPFSMDEFVEITKIPVDPRETRYREPLERDARQLAANISADACVVLLGSIATPKYVAPLLDIFGPRLLFPADFVGRGDMSRGGLMLRHARSGEELEYIPVASAVRRGPRPARLPRLS